MTAQTKPIYTPDEIIALLSDLYGPAEWRPHGDAMSELVLTVLSQNTADANSGRAFSRLLQRFPDWQDIIDAPTEAVVEAIQPAGLSEMKGPRLQAMLVEIKRRTGGFDINFLEDLPVEQAREWLRSLHGVGPKTAACVLLFGLGLPGLPVDTHVYRVTIRLGLVSPKLTPEKAQTQLEAEIPAKDHYQFHLLIIHHGRHTCTARAPACYRCPLQERCPSAFMATSDPQQATRSN